MTTTIDVAHFKRYHKALKLYLGISQDHLTPITSSRVAKAREKLGRLTEIQFYDLSTDVYDELQRRINETNERPKHLPPQSSYHPKRNQARQKLAALPSQRFKDLVNDVLFEIEKRELMSPSEIVFAEVGDGADGVDGASVGKNYEKNYEQKKYNKYEKKSPQRNRQIEPALDVDLPASAQPAQREIKASTVVPHRAELTWSNDEDDEEFEEAREAVRGPEVTQEAKDIANSFVPSGNESTTAGPIPGTVQHQIVNSGKRTVSQEKDAVARDLATAQATSTEVSSLQAKLEALETDYKKLQVKSAQNEEELTASLRQQTDKNRQLSQSLEEVQKEKSQLAQITEQQRKQISGLQKGAIDKSVFEDKNADLQKQLDSLTESHSALKDEHRELQRQNEELQDQHIALQDEHGKLQKQHVDLSKKLATSPTSTHYDATSPSTSRSIDTTPAPKTTTTTTTTTATTTNTASSKPSLLMEPVTDLKELQTYCSGTGLIPVEPVADLYAATESLYKYLAGGKIDSDGLFSNVSSVGTAAQLIIKSAPSGKYEERVTHIKGALSNLFTSTRYYAIYKDVMPLLLMHASIGDVYFAVCDLLGAAKVKATSKNLIKALDDSKATLASSAATLSSTTATMATAAAMTTTTTTGGIPSSGSTTSRSLESQTPSKIAVPTGASIPDERVPHTPTYDDGSSSVRPLRMAQKLSSPQGPSNPAEERPHGLGAKMSPINPIQTKSLSNSATKLSSSTKSSGSNKNDTPFYTSGNVSVSSLASKFSNTESPSKKSIASGSAQSTPRKGDNDNLSKIREKFETPPEEMNGVKISGSGTPSPIKYNTKPTTKKVFNAFADDDDDDDEEGEEAVPAKGIQKEDSNKAIYEDASEPSGLIGNPLDSPVPDAVNLKKGTMKDVPDLTTPKLSGSERLMSPIATQEANSTKTDANANANANAKANAKAAPIVDYDDDDREEEGEEEEEEFDVEKFNTLDPDNTLKELLMYLEAQTAEVIAAIQLLLTSIRDPQATRGLLRRAAGQIVTVVKQMCEGTRTLMKQSRYTDTMGHARYVVDMLDDCVERMTKLYGTDTSRDDEYADKQFKQRSAGIAFDVARSTKELVKTTEEAKIRDEIAVIGSRLNQGST